MPKTFDIGLPLFSEPLAYVEGGMYRGGTEWRNVYMRDFGFLLYAEDWIKALAKWIGERPCLEIMAGTGMLSKFLKEYGVDVIATDNFSWSAHFNKIVDVKNQDCFSAIRELGKSVKFVILSWPYMSNDAWECVKLMRQVNPCCRMIYIGEWAGGCCANYSFFEGVEVCEVKTFTDAVRKYRHWFGLHDKIWLVK